MAFASLPRDACFHLLMQEHPVDLYQVSQYVPQLNKVARQGHFLKAHTEKWVPLLQANLTTQAVAGLAVLRRDSYIMQYVKPKIQQEAFFLLWERGDIKTVKWMIRNFSFFSDYVANDLLNHPQINPHLIHALFDRGHVNPSAYLAGQSREVINQYLYRHDANYTDFFVQLVKHKRYEDVQYYLSPCLSFDQDQLMESALQHQDLRAVTLYLAQLTYSRKQVWQFLKRNDMTPEIRSLLVAQLPPDYDVKEEETDHDDELTVEEIEGCPNGQRYMERKHGFIVAVDQDVYGSETIKAIGICSGDRHQEWSRLTILPLTDHQKKIARMMGLTV